MDQEVKTFENDSFSAEATELEGCRVSVKVFVKPNSAQKAYQKAVKIVNKQISIPGFRKGKAPDRTVITRYSSYIEQEWKELIVNDAYRAALDLTNIYPMNKESIQKPKIESCSQEEGAVVQVAYEHYPHIPLVEFSNIKLPTIEKEQVTDEKVNEVLEEVRRTNADWEDIAERPIEEGDFVDISIDSIEDKANPTPIVQDRRFEVAEKRLTPWLQKLLVGMNIGDSVESESELDPHADAGVKKNFKPTKVRVTVHAIKKIILPPVDEELVKKAGASSVEDLKDKIRQNLEKAAEEERENKRFEALENALLEHYHFDLPASIVESERKERISRRIKSLKNENVSDEEVKAKEGQIAREVTTEIDHALRLYFLNKQIAKQGEISVSNQELNDELVRYLTQNPYQYGNETDETATRELVSRMAMAMMQRKAKEYALAQVQS